MKKVIGLLMVAWCAVLAAHAAGASPEKIGEEILTTLETAHPYVVAPERAGGILWSQVIRSPGATYIAPHFSRFHLAAGDSVVVRSPDGSQSWSYSGFGRAERGEIGGFWAVHINGDTAIVELTARQGGDYGFAIDKYARGYRADEMEARLGPESICGADDSDWAKCYQDSEPAIYDTSRAVARILVQGTVGCTAWLVGTAGHIMTNYHCILDQDDASNTDYEFMAEGATCGTNCATFGGCPGVIESTTGTLLASDVNLDYSLVLLPTNVTARYGFLRLRGTLPALHERVYIPGHPGAWGKRLAVASTDPSNPSGYCEVDTVSAAVCVGGAVPEVGYVCDTQGGSSGSPVIAYSDNRVVAMHHCAGCPNTGVRIPELIARLGPNLPPGALFDPAGKIRLSKDSYGCSDLIGIELRDDSLIGSGGAGVRIGSGSEPVGEPVSLLETASGSGVFVGSIVTTPTSPAVDGELSVTDDDPVTVSYVDADDGTGGTDVPRTDTARIDCAPPEISSVGAFGVTGNSAVVTWLTSEPADSNVTHGDSLPPAFSTFIPALSTSHIVHLAGLLPCRTYYFSVQSSDEAHNLANDDNDGAYHTFTTGTNTNPTFAATGVPIAIPDNAPAGITSSIVVTDVKTVVDVNVRIRVTHTFDADLDLFLVGPNGLRIVLSTDNGGSGNHFDNTVFDDEAGTPITAGAAPFAGSFRPEMLLSTFDGSSAAGTWTLEVVDDARFDLGTLDKFELILTYPPQPCGAFLQAQSQEPSDSCAQGGPGNGDGIIDPGELVSIAVRAVNTGTDPATNVTATLTSTTPGVTVLDGSAAYPDLASEAVALGDAPFSVRLTPDFPCQTPIDFQVTFAATQGTWSSTFSFPTGTPISAAGRRPIEIANHDVGSRAPISWLLRKSTPRALLCNTCAGCPDGDEDDVCDEADNCPTAPNPDQQDADGDAAGDVCDPCPLDSADDADEDGVCGDVDSCPASILDPTVIVPPAALSPPPPGTAPGTTLPCDTRVPNSLLADGCTISDKIAACDASSRTKQQFEKCVRRLLNQLRRHDVITERQRKAILRCVKKYKHRDTGHHGHSGREGRSDG